MIRLGFSVLAIMLFSLCGGWAVSESTEIIEKGNQSYLALGDSYTVGEAVPTHASWPFQLVDSLKEAGYLILPPDVVAKTGWTTGELISAIEKKELQSDYDLVSLSIGVNNQYRGLSQVEFENEFRVLLNMAIRFAAGDQSNVFVVSIPDYGYTPFGNSKKEKIGKEIDAFNSICEKVCKEKGILFINITADSRMMVKSDNWIAKDGLHPGEQQYSKWVNTILPQVISLLEE